MVPNPSSKIMASNLSAVIASINKKYGDNTINFVKDMKQIDVERLSSGSLSLDSVLGFNKGKYGWPMCRLVELYGKQQSGKSLISLLTIANAQKEGIKCIYIDGEHGFDPEFAEKLGVNTDSLILSQISVGEDTVDMICELLQVEEKMVIVVDSVASMVPMKEMEDSMEQQNIALTARLMSKGLRKIVALNKSALIILINQIRTNVGTYGNPDITPGGRALGHYTSIRVEVKQGEPLEQSKKRIGQVVKFRVTKNKTGNPYGDGYFKFYYDGTIDRIDELVTIGLLNKKIKQSGAFYELAGEKFRGRESMEMELEAKPELFEKARKEILA